MKETLKGKFPPKQKIINKAPQENKAAKANEGKDGNETSNNESDYEGDIDSKEEDKKRLNEEKRCGPTENEKLIQGELQTAIHVDQNLTWKNQKAY